MKSTQNFKFGLAGSLMVQPSAYSYYHFGRFYAVSESRGALALGVIGTAVMLAVPLGARSTVMAINLQSSGEEVHLHTGTITGVQLGRNPARSHWCYE